MLETRVGQAEVVEAVLQGDAGDRDAEVGHVGKVGQAAPARLVGLSEDDVLLGPVHGAPGANAALQRAADAAPEFGMAAHHLLEHGDGAQAGGGPQHGYHLRIEDLAERIWAPAAAEHLAGRGQSRLLRDPVPGRPAHRRLGGRDGHGVGLTVLHEEPHLVIGHVMAGHEGLPSRRGRAPHCRPVAITIPAPTGPSPLCRSLRSNFALPQGTAQRRVSS